MSNDLPDMKPVISSNVESVGHNGKDLFVTFTNGATYKYLNVPETELNIIISAASIGKYINSDIKPFYQFERIM